MTMIKASAASGVLPFRPVPPAAEHDLALELIDPVVERLEAQVAELRSELEAARRDVVLAGVEAREEGARDVMLDDAAHLQAIEAGLEQARALWNERLRDAELLSVSVARTALSRMFDEHQDLAALIERTITTHMARLGANAVVRLRVSPADFPDAAALARIAMGLGEDALVTDPGLNSGESRVDLRLGEADLDLAAQWRELEAAIANLEPAKPAA